MANEELSIWVLYEKPADHPDKFVGRRWKVKPEYGPTQDTLFADNLDALRAQLPDGLTMITRSPGDDSVIVESWI